jgi:hypothetical protein
MAEITGLTPAPTTTTVAHPPLSAGFPSPPQFDVIELLPEHAQNRLRQLRQRKDDAHRLIPPFEQIREASMARVDAANGLKRLTSHQQDGGFNLPETDARVIAATKQLDKATDDFERQKALQTERSAAFQIAGAALANVEAWLRDGQSHGSVLEHFDGPTPKLNKGESVLDAVERLHRRGRELKADLHRIASAPYPSAYAKQQMREQIEALAMQGAPSVSALVELDGKIVWPMQMMRSEVRGGEHPALAFAETLDAVALTCWLHKSALIAALDREIATEADDKAALSHEAREKAEAEVMGDLLAIERDETALVWQAQSQNLPIEHRADINPVALLGLQLITRARVSEAPETSRGYSWLMRR